MQSKIGDYVKTNNCRRIPGLSKAFTQKFIGPLKIVKRVGGLNYVLEAPNLKFEFVHLSRYNVRLLPAPVSNALSSNV